MIAQCVQFIALAWVLVLVCANIQSHECVDTRPISFHLHPGYLPTDFGNISDHMNPIQSMKYLYSCGASWYLLGTHFVKNDTTSTPSGSSSHSSFYGKKFLTQHRNKTILVVGDSLGKQLYQEFITSLYPYQTELKSSQNWTAKVSNFNEVHIETYYGDYNVTLIGVADPYMEFFQHKTTPGRLDLIIFGVGYWFKPMFMRRSNPNTTYYEHLEMMIPYFKQSLQVARRKAKQLNPDVKVVWRLMSHVGLCDEIDFFPQYFANTTEKEHEYTNGLFWSNVTLEATWVPRYNAVIREVAEEHCDLLLDAYTISHKYLEFFAGQTKKIQVHIDGMHYCPGGVARGEVWYVQQLLHRHAMLHHHSHHALQ
ncbi:hypothetical protein EON63_15610 [archaeon]|nr:MAG: hypothetical protein EON63_15610 [archaeon]